MSVIYNVTAINARLQAVQQTIDAGGSNGDLVLLANSTVISTIALSRPSAIVNNGVLIFQGTPIDVSASGTGFVTTAQFWDSNGSVVVSGLSVGTPGGTADVIISNGLNSTFISAGQVVSVLAVQIIGS